MQLKICTAIIKEKADEKERSAESLTRADYLLDLCPSCWYGVLLGRRRRHDVPEETK